jgi:hypothetical protein
MENNKGEEPAENHYQIVLRDRKETTPSYGLMGSLRFQYRHRGRGPVGMRQGEVQLPVAQSWGHRPARPCSATCGLPRGFRSTSMSAS